MRISERGLRNCVRRVYYSPGSPSQRRVTPGEYGFQSSDGNPRDQRRNFKNSLRTWNQHQRLSFASRHLRPNGGRRFRFQKAATGVSINPVAQANKLFGTDGVRGLANVEPVTAETALKLGRAAAHVFTQLNPRTLPAGARPKIVLGKDTRLSGYMLENALVAGITSLGVDVLVIGPLPTPGVAYITRSLRADAGIVLSASHNSYEDNGIKFFRHDGYKLDDKVEQQIEQLVFTGEIDAVRPTAGNIGRATRIDDALGRYVEFAKASFPRGMSLEKMRIAVVVRTGAPHKSTPCIWRQLGADLTVAHNEPNGTNINADCGSTHPSEI